MHIIIIRVWESKNKIMSGWMYTIASSEMRPIVKVQIKSNVVVILSVSLDCLSLFLSLLWVTSSTIYRRVCMWCVCVVLNLIWVMICPVTVRLPMAIISPVIHPGWIRFWIAWPHRAWWPNLWLCRQHQPMPSRPMATEYKSPSLAFLYH